MGAVSPLGNTVEELWKNAKQGMSGVEKIDRFDVSDLSTKIAATIKNLDVGAYISHKEAKRIDLFQIYGIIAAQQALDDSKIFQYKKINNERIGVSVGSGIGGIQTIEENILKLDKYGAKKVSPFFVPSGVVNMLAGNIGMRFGLKGPNFAISTACATGVHNIGYSLRTIQYGDADVMLAGGSEMSVTRVGISAFGAARALSTCNENPESASRPWDEGRDGFVMGEGAAILVLEELEHAIERGAKIYGEVKGFGMSDDAFHITAPPINGEGAARSIINSIKDASINLEDINYINAHGTSTIIGDKAEMEALKSVFGGHSKNLKISGTKSMTGHLLGAAGALESIFTILSVKNNVMLPTINLKEQSKDCDLHVVKSSNEDLEIKNALNNSFGFGGTNAVLVFSKF
jgi:3-oxoacyl-[acyl-carrier-protein] synthase II